MALTKEERWPEVHDLPALNGLRGVASVIVMIYHGMAAYGPGVWYGYGVDQNFGIHQLPVVRALFDGSSMVFLFYALSGFILALKPLSLVKQRRWDAAFQALSSSAIRRPLRLFLPALVTTSGVMMLHWVGFFEYAEAVSILAGNRRVVEFRLPATRFSSFYDQVADWCAQSAIMMNPFTWDRTYNAYNAHLWTLTAQLRASYVAFLVLLIGARLGMTARMGLLCGTVMLFAKHQKWEIATTLSGILLAELQLYLDCPVRSNKGNQRWTVLIFLLGIFLASYPKLKGDETPGFRTVTALTPAGLIASKWWKSVGAWLLLWAANNSPQAKWLLTTRVSQYLGSISTGIYMLHGPIFHSLGIFLMTTTGKYTGRDTATQKTMSFAASALIIFPALFVLAQCFTWLVDAPCARFSKWLETKLYINEHQRRNGGKYINATRHSQKVTSLGRLIRD